MLPFTPLGRDNLIAWFAGRCDEPNYGELIVYKLPKDRMIYGTLQIEARAEQKPKNVRKVYLMATKRLTSDKREFIGYLGCKQFALCRTDISKSRNSSTT